MRLLPALLRPRATDEYVPPAPAPAERRAAARAEADVRERSRECRLDPRAYAETRPATAVALRALDGEAGGGFFAVPDDATRDDAAASEAFDDPGGPPLIDVQTHLINPARFVGGAAQALTWFLGFADENRWRGGVDPLDLGPAMWAEVVFARSETAAALITLPPGAGDGRLVDNDEVARCRTIVDELAGPDRVLSHCIVHPNLSGELAAMGEWAERCAPSGWKCYPLFGDVGGTVGWRLDDDIGTAFLEEVTSLGPPLVAVHKGISGPVPDVAPAGASPSDVGPAAATFPGIDFVIYHSGYEPGWHEGPYDPAAGGVDALVRSLAEVGLGPGDNVYAELGSTWHLVLRKPEEAAHVLGKLLVALGPERIVWGTDSVWYGSPQPLIDAFRSFRIPEWMQDRFGYPPLTPEIKRRILSTNASTLYDLEPRPRTDDWVAQAADELARAFPLD